MIQHLADNGVTVLDIQKVDYKKLQYDNGEMQHFNKDMCFFKLRGSTYSIQVGFVLKLARENLLVQFENVNKSLNKYFQNIDFQYGSIFAIT